jgi:HEAT repeat protein
VVTGREPQLPPDTSHSGDEPQLGGGHRIRLKKDILADLNRGRWVPAKELERVVRLIPPEEKRRYAEALLARLDVAPPLGEPSFWRLLFRRRRDERLNLIDSLGILGDPIAAPALRARLTDTELQSRAIVALGRLRAPDAVDPLTHLLHNPNLNVLDRRHAVEALGLIAHPGAIQTLLGVLDGPDPGTVKRSAITALGKICGAANRDGDRVDTTVIERLRQVIQVRNDDYRYRKVAARALARSGDVRAVVTLMDCLHDRSSEVRYTAARGLAWLGDPAAIPALTIASATDPDPRVREAASKSILRLQP